MVQNPDKWREFETERLKREPVDPERNFAILDALYEEACFLGVLPSRNPQEEIAAKVRFVRTVHRVQSPDRENR